MACGSFCRVCLELKVKVGDEVWGFYFINFHRNIRKNHTAAFYRFTATSAAAAADANGNFNCRFSSTIFKQFCLIAFADNKSFSLPVRPYTRSQPPPHPLAPLAPLCFHTDLAKPPPTWRWAKQAWIGREIRLEGRGEGRMGGCGRWILDVALVAALDAPFIFCCCFFYILLRRYLFLLINLAACRTVPCCQCGQRVRQRQRERVRERERRNINRTSQKVERATFEFLWNSKISLKCSASLSFFKCVCVRERKSECEREKEANQQE